MYEFMYVCMCAWNQGKMLFHSVETKEQEELFMTKELAYTKPLVSSHAYIRKYKPIYLKKIIFLCTFYVYIRILYMLDILHTCT